MKHPAADIFAEIAEEARHNPEPWKAFEGTGSDGRSWIPPSSMGCLLRWVDSSVIQVRRRPRTIEIAGVEFPEPMREVPEVGSTYYIPCPGSGEPVMAITWDSSAFDRRHLNAGMAQQTAEGARLQSRALIIASGGDPDA